jgi:hypothetical protein
MKITHSHKDYSPIDWQDMTDWFSTPLGDYLLQHPKCLCRLDTTQVIDNCNCQSARGSEKCDCEHSPVFAIPN